mgnify:CR=1 FL=1
MSKKTLNKANLAALGADRLADLLMEVSQGSADIKRRLRLELSHNLGAAELAHEVRKRLASLRKSKSFISWRKRKALIKDLETQVSMIVDKIAPDDPGEAFELLWQFIDLAPALYERVDDRRCDVGTVFREAILNFAVITPRMETDVEALADRVWGAISDNGYGEWDGLIELMAPSLGEAGLAQLQSHVERFAAAAPVETAQEHEAIAFLRELPGGTDYKAMQKQRFVQQCLQDIARERGDTDAFIAQYTPDDLHNKAIAAQVAMLLLNDGRAEDALTLLRAAEEGRVFGHEAWDDAYIAALLALGREAEAQAHRWHCFEKRLSVDHLRAFLKDLPDFEDVEAEDRARAYALRYPNVLVALHFCLAWPDLLTASELVLSRAEEIDGDHYELLTPAADALRERYPLAATLLWRSMIDFALSEGRASRYPYVAEHLKDCAAVAGQIHSFESYGSHDDYLEALKNSHERKSSFWSEVAQRATKAS